MKDWDVERRGRDEADAMEQMVASWPIILRALNRAGILKDSDRNDIRFSVQRLVDGASLKNQIERALEPKAQDLQNRKKKADGT